MFPTWIFRIGLGGGALLAVGAVLISLEDFGLTMATAVLGMAEDVATLGGFVFMLVGWILLVSAVRYLRQRWAELSPFAKFVGVFGLLMTSFVGGYIYHYFFARSSTGGRNRGR